MAYNINLADIFNNLTNQGIQGGKPGVNAAGGNLSAASGQMTNNAVEQLKRMLVGDIFTGEIMDMKGELLSIKMGNGQILNANLSMEGGEAAFQKGDMVTFLVSDKSDSQVALKPLDTSAQELVMANKALESANLAMNKENLAIVKGLIDLNMPIDKKTLGEVARLMTKFPDASTDTILRLYKLGMPVTEENITQYEAYKSYEHDMTGTLKSLAEDFTSMLLGMQEGVHSEVHTDKVVALAKELTALFTADLPENTGEQGEKTEAAKQDVLKFVKELPLEVKEHPEQAAKEVIEFVKKQNLPPKETMNLLGELAKTETLPKETLAKMFSSKEFGEVFREVLKETMFLKPENVADKKEVKEFYNKLIQMIEEGQKVLEKAQQSGSDMAKGMASVKSNLEFMNDLNHQMAYVQIPIKFQEGEAKGDLYVYTNKKSSANKKDDLTALLHLDMEYLGALDVYVKMAGNNVSTNFCLETEELLDFIYDHIELLTERLNKKGYNFTPTMTVREEGKNIDFEKDFLDVASPVVPVSRYMFDIKA